MNNGIVFYKLKSEYPGDTTKNCSLMGQEVDNNFYVLEGRDIKEVAVDGSDIKVTLMNGEVLTAKTDFVTTDMLASTVNNIEFDKVGGVLKITSSNGEEQEIKGFATTYNDSLSVATDGTLRGEGLRRAPLGISPMAKTGQYRPVKKIIKVVDGEVLPCKPLVGERYLTEEQVSDYGYLYNYRAVRKIAAELKASNSGWRIPTKEDWDDMLNGVEHCEADRTHGKADLGKYLGHYAGKMLKSKHMWKPECEDCDDFCQGHHHHHPHHDHFHDEDAMGCIKFEDDAPSCGHMMPCDEEHKCHPHHHEHGGLDIFGLRITPAGYADDGGNFGYFGERAAFWTATNTNGCSSAYIKRFEFDKNTVYQNVYGGQYYVSLRLVKDYTGDNFYGDEDILDNTYPTVLMPSKEGHKVWTAINVACANADLQPMTPNNGQGITFSRRFYINEWNGRHWMRNEVRDGETVTVEWNPRHKKNIEYRVDGEKLLNINAEIFKDVIREVMPKVDELETSLTASITKVSNDLDNEISTRTANDIAHDTAINANAEGIESLETALRQEKANREENDTLLQGNIDEVEAFAHGVNERLIQEVADREHGDVELREALDDEIQARKDADDNLQTEIDELDAKVNKEITNRTSADETLQTEIDEEVEARTAADNEIKESLAAETEARENADKEINNRIDAVVEEHEGDVAKVKEDLDAEIERAKAREDELAGDILTAEGTEFDIKTGILTLNSADGSNKIQVQFTANFGTF